MKTNEVKKWPFITSGLLLFVYSFFYIYITIHNYIGWYNPNYGFLDAIFRNDVFFPLILVFSFMMLGLILFTKKNDVIAILPCTTILLVEGFYLLFSYSRREDLINTLISNVLPATVILFLVMAFILSNKYPKLFLTKIICFLPPITQFIYLVFTQFIHLVVKNPFARVNLSYRGTIRPLFLPSQCLFLVALIFLGLGLALQRSGISKKETEPIVQTTSEDETQGTETVQ